MEGYEVAFQDTDVPATGGFYFIHVLALVP